MADDVIGAIYQADHPTDLRPFCTDGDAFGPCPCFSIDQPGFRAEGRCWRAGFTGFNNFYDEPPECNHDGCCVHVKTTDPDAALRLKHLLDDMDWYGEWALVLEEWTPAYQGDGTCGCLACVDWSRVHGRCRAWPRKGDTCTDPWGFGCQCNDGGDQECEGCWLYGK